MFFQIIRTSTKEKVSLPMRSFHIITLSSCLFVDCSFNSNILILRDNVMLYAIFKLLHQLITMLSNLKLSEVGKPPNDGNFKVFQTNKKEREKKIKGYVT